MPPAMPGAFAPPLPLIGQQRYPVASALQHPCAQQQQLPFFDSRIPPPTVTSGYVGQNSSGVPPNSNDPARNNPVPYG
ncbi:unnamed protein product [Gongylonema pulchrum]|uniref:Uncharacterized protein n=1 Tax=Gongylonema pulchrum TaxID=637853 RepID=A0A183EFF8_9BILA|nr:unnamed protein product [Gongylonema pulchrum]